MYQALYRKWRPQKFEDVSGQLQVTKTLKNALKADRVNHAYLFTGSRGTGKTTCAKILAKAVNCLNPQDGDPCCECEICRGIDDGSVLDVVEMDAASNRKIDDIRDIIDEAQFRPARAKYRVYIVDEVHMLTDQAFNALLKTLEEPPEHVIFILATTEIHKLPSTILSRCQRFDFHRISPSAIVSRLKYVTENEGAQIDEDAARLIASVSDGALRDALSLLDRCLGNSTNVTAEVVRNTAGLARKDYLFELASACINKNTSKALELLGNLHQESKSMQRLCDELLDHFRSLMMIKATRHPRDLIIMSDDEFEDAQLQSDYLTLGEIVYMMDILQNAYKRMGKGNSNKTELEMAMVRLTSTELEGTNEALTARVSALEKALKSGILPTQPSVNPIGEKPEKQAAKPEPEEEAAQPEKQEEPKKQANSEQTAKIEETPPPVSKDELPPPPPEIEPEPQKTSKAPEAVDYDTLYSNAKPFRQWSEVVQNILKYSKAIGSALSDADAYESGDFILIDTDSEIAFKLLKESARRKDIHNAILEVTGRKYRLGPYKKQKEEQKKDDPLEKLISDLKSKGIEVNEE